MPEYVLGALDAADHDALRAHLATGCPACSGALAEAQAFLAALPQSLPLVTPPAAARARLLQRLHRRRLYTFPRLLVTSSIAALLAVGIAIAAFLPMFRHAEDKTLADPNIRLISLSGTDMQPSAHGRIVWNPESDSWNVYLFNLKPLKSGMIYELWCITDQQKPMPAGVIDLRPDGSARMSINLPRIPGKMALAAITDEPMPGTQSPTGQIQMKGPIP